MMRYSGRGEARCSGGDGSGEPPWACKSRSVCTRSARLEEKMLCYSLLVWLRTCWVHKGPEGASRTHRSGRIKYPYCHRVSNRISLVGILFWISLAAYGGVWFDCECCHSKVIPARRHKLPWEYFFFLFFLCFNSICNQELAKKQPTCRLETHLMMLIGLSLLFNAILHGFVEILIGV